MFENYCVETGNVNAWEDDQCANHNGVEEEPICVCISEERERALGVRIQAEHTTTDTFDLPRRDQDQLGKLGENSSAGAEHDVARVAVGSVAVMPKISFAGPIYNDDKSE